MKEKFRKWLTKTGKTNNTANNYSNAINRISEHYSQNTNENVNIYNVRDINKLNEISKKYALDGDYWEFGNNGNGTNRNAIARYVEFFTQNITETRIKNTNNFNNDTSQNQNFSYEKDLQTALRLQINTLFPKYKIYGSNSEGIEYVIKNRRIDLLLEHIDTKDLLVIELKSGEADYKVFGQISMYIGLLQSKFPNRNIKGIIIASSIQDSLRQAISITDKINVKTYKIKLELE